MGTHGSDQPDVRLQIHDVELATADQRIAVVRCVAGPARLGARFGHVSPALDLVLRKIEVYHVVVEELAHGWTGRVTLTGVGAHTAHPA